MSKPSDFQVQDYKETDSALYIAQDILKHKGEYFDHIIRLAEAVVEANLIQDDEEMLDWRKRYAE